MSSIEHVVSGYPIANSRYPLSIIQHYFSSILDISNTNTYKYFLGLRQGASIGYFRQIKIQIVKK